MNNCLICGKEVSKNGTPYTVCKDEFYKHNVWGGDSHEIIGYVCEDCFKKLHT